MLKSMSALVVLPVLAGCSLMTDILSSRDVHVSVDPVIQQRVTTLATGDSVFNSPSLDPQAIPCSVSSPRTCSVANFVWVTVVNDGPEAVEYLWSCPPPFQRKEDGDWVPFATFSVCNASLQVSPVGPGGRAEFPLWLVDGTVPYDWRHSQDEFRVVLRLRDADGDLPAHMRTSASFHLRLQ